MYYKIEIDWSDLDADTQDKIMNEVAEVLFEEAQSEGEMLLNKEWNEPKPETWQEAYVRYNGIDYSFWRGFENDLEEDKPTFDDWKLYLDSYIQSQAEKRCELSMKNKTISIDINI